ncbi:MAG: phage tail protein [Allosphingosinicella sp.]
MNRTVHLHGHVGRKFGRRHVLDVGSPAEAVRALAYQVPGFAQYIRSRRYVVTVGDGVVIPGDALPLRLGKQRDIHITPASLVAGVEVILLGATLLFVAIAAVGVLTMPKAPKPATREEATKTASFMFDGAQNVTEQGHPVPLVYGIHRAGSVLASAGIATTDVNQASVSTDPTNPSYGGGVYGGYVGETPGFTGSELGREWQQPPGEPPLAKGGKGAGGSTRSAQEDANTLQSQATARLLEIVSEGEIVGLVDGLKSVYLDETPLQNPDGSFNFAGVAVEQRVGLPDQDFIPGFTQAEATREIDTKVTVALGPVTRTIDDANATVARVTIRLPQLYQQDTENGDLKASSVSVKVSVQVDGGGFSDVATMDFVGKTNSGYQRSIDVRLPNGESRDVRVTRITPDSAVASLSNETRWDLLTEIVEAKLSYPDTAMIGLTVDARQFGSSIPTRSYDLKGLIIEVPTNYDPEARTYAGIWDGTFKRAWSNNPAWILRDLITNRRYGLGARVPPEALDKWALYAASQYNDGLVPDGKGGMQPRYTLNCCISNAASAYDVIASVCSTFRGWAYWGSGAISIAQDRPEDPSVLITRANVLDGKISYGRITPVEKRRSVAIVYWNDPSDGYRLTPAFAEKAELIRRFGRRAGDPVTGFGISNEGQATRMARWILEDESPSSNTSATYGVGDDHAFVEPGRIASIADSMYTQQRRGGRVKAATAASVTLDSPYTFEAGDDYTLRVMLPDGTVSVRPATNGPGAATVVALGGADWATPPNPGAVWTIETTAVANRQFRVRSILTDEPPFKVQAMLHDPTKYERVELERDIPTPVFLDLPTGPLEPPVSLDAIEFLLRDGDAAIPSVQVSWRPSRDPRLAFYQAQFQRPGGNYEPFADGIDVSRVVRGTEAGEWSFRVRALDTLGRKTAWVEQAFDLDGLVDALPNVTGLSFLSSGAGATPKLYWDPPTDTRPLRYEVFYSFANDLSGAVSLGLVDTTEYPVSLSGYYWVRTTFIAAASAAPPSIHITDAELVIAAALSPALTNDAVSLTADGDGNVASYVPATGSFKVLQGTTDVSASFALSTVAGGNPQALAVTYVGQTYTVTGGLDADEDNATLRIRATGSGTFAGIAVDKIFSLSKSKQGDAGNKPDLKFMRSAAPPATPTGDDPAGWSDGIPSGNGPLYSIRGNKTSLGVLIGTWSTPQLIGGQISPVPYNPDATYYQYQTVTFGGGTYMALGTTTGNAPSGTGQANAHWDVIAAPGEPGTPATPPSGFTATINLAAGAGVNLRTVADAAGYTGASDATITFRVPAGVTIRGAAGGVGLDTGTWPTSSFTIALTLEVQNGGVVDGGGGAGGAASYSDGDPGGDAIYCRVPMPGGITIDAGGSVRGGGGGGGAGRGDLVTPPHQPPSPDDPYYGGGGGGGGQPNGPGGSGEAGSNGGTDGADGAVGTAGGPGAGGAGDVAGGAGGAYGLAGGDASGTGGAAGYAVRKNGFAVAVTNNGTMTGAAA